MENKLQNVFDKYLSLTIGEIKPVKVTGVYSEKLVVWVNENNVEYFITNLNLKRQQARIRVLWVYEDVYTQASNLFGVDEKTIDEMFVHWFNEHQNLIKLDPNTYVKLETRN